MSPVYALPLRGWAHNQFNRQLSTSLLSDRKSETVPGERSGQCNKLPCMAEPSETTSLLERIKASKTPFLDALPEKEQVFVLTCFAKGNQSKAARHLGVSRDNVRYRMKKYGITRR